MIAAALLVIDMSICLISELLHLVLITNPYCTGLRDHLGDCIVVGDTRWAGSYGIDADFVAREHCAVLFIKKEDIQVVSCSIP